MDLRTRKVSFFDLWYKAIQKFSNPQKIIVIDSASPVKPVFQDKPLVNWYELNQNYGAGLDGTKNKRLSGWDRGILASASLAFFEDCDYYVYVEQDCLIKGKGIIEYAIKNMTKPLMLGSGKGTPQPLQQSFIIIKKEFIPFFIEKEMKASQDVLTQDCEVRYDKHFKGNYEYLPFDYGRKRPINFKDKYLYAQHLRTDEMNEFIKYL